MNSDHALLTSLQEDNAEKINPVRRWFTSHWQSLKLSLSSMLQTPFNSAVALAVIAIAMTLPAGLYVLLDNLHQLSNQWQGTPTISIYLKQDVEPNKLMRTIKRYPQVARLKYISPHEGLKQFTKQTNLRSVVATLSDNPLPGLIIIYPKKDAETPELLKLLFSQVKQLPGISLAQMDAAWVERLYYLVTLGERVVYTLGFLFALGVILVISNTIRLLLEDRREEIAVLQLIGATSGYIRRPLLYRGLMTGLIGGMIACVVTSILLSWLETPAQALAQTYSASIILHHLSFNNSLAMIVISGMLGLLGALWAVQRHL